MKGHSLVSNSTRYKKRGFGKKFLISVDSILPKPPFA